MTYDPRDPTLVVTVNPRDAKNADVQHGLEYPAFFGLFVAGVLTQRRRRRWQREPRS